MSYDPEKHHRKSIRLKGFDYSRLATYFVTICVENRECLFENILRDKCESVNDRVLLNDAGKMVSAEWLNLQSRFHSLILDDLVVMSNHFHAIIHISSDSVANPKLGQIIGAFKSIVTRNYITGVHT